MVTATGDAIWNNVTISQSKNGAFFVTIVLAVSGDVHIKSGFHLKIVETCKM